MRDRRGLFAGVVLIVAGALFLLDELRIAAFDDVVSAWWPMLIVLFGVFRLFRGNSVWSGVWMIGIGAWLEVVQLHLYGMTINNSWPVLLIIFGAGVTLRALSDTFAKEKRHEG